MAPKTPEKLQERIFQALSSPAIKALLIVALSSALGIDLNLDSLAPSPENTILECKEIAEAKGPLLVPEMTKPQAYLALGVEGTLIFSSANGTKIYLWQEASSAKIQLTFKNDILQEFKIC